MSKQDLPTPTVTSSAVTSSPVTSNPVTSNTVTSNPVTSNTVTPTTRLEPGQLLFDAPRRGKPPRHLADLSPAARKAAVMEAGLPGFRAAQLSKHYFERLVDDPADWTDVPAAQRESLHAALFPRLLIFFLKITGPAGTTPLPLRPLLPV